MIPSIAQLYLAYRQAKAALFFERRGVGLLEFSEYEKNLPDNLSRLRAMFSGGFDWFDHVDVGQVWIVPKRYRSIDRDEGVIHIGTAVGLRGDLDLDVQVRLSPSPEFAVMEILYLWKFGSVLEAELTKSSVGYRLDLREGHLSTRRWLFEFWPRRYQEFRSEPLKVARRELVRGSGSVRIMSADLASFYDTVDSSFLLHDFFVEKLRKGADAVAGEFSVADYRSATISLVGAYDRFRRVAARRTGLSWGIGIPIGALTSRVVANVALSTLDHYIEQQENVICYRRYVDDIVLVARLKDVNAVRQDVRDVLARHLPLESPGTGEVLSLDTSTLNREGSEFQLQLEKVKVHHLSGVQGADFVDAISVDFQRVVSEGRAFVDEAAILGDGVSRLIRAGVDEGSPLRVLRKADRARLERFALSNSLRSLERVSQLVDRDQAREFVRRTLERIIRVLDADEIWPESLDVSMRLLKLSIIAEDWDSCGELTAAMDRHWETVEALKRSLGQMFHRNRPIDRDRALSWISLRNYLHARRLEEVVSVLRFDRDSQGSNYWMSKGLQVGTRRLRFVALRYRAVGLAAADLRSRDREDDDIDSSRLSEVEPNWMLNLLQDDEDLTRRLFTIREFVDLCGELQDRPWHMAPARLFLCTRPPSYFDIARRWLYRTEEQGFNHDVFDRLLEVVNAIRGTQYKDPIGSVVDDGTVVIRSKRQDDESLVDPRLILGNLAVRDEYWKGAATRVLGSTEGRPVLDVGRICGLSRVLDKAADVANATREPAGERVPSLLVLPELSVPRRWFRTLSNHVVRFFNFGFVVGLEYRHDLRRPVVLNQAFAVLPGPYSSVATWPWSKFRPAREEKEALASLSTPVAFSSLEIKRPRTVVHSAWGTFSVLICSELIEARRVADLLGRVELVICPAWNKDTASYEHLIQTVGLQLHAIVAVANNGCYSDCRAWAPYVERWRRDICRLVERSEDDVVFKDLPLTALRRFHEGVIELDRRPEWRPLPPSWP